MKEDERGWNRTKENDIGRKRIKENEREWRRMKEDERGWEVERKRQGMKEDEREWTRMKGKGENWRNMSPFGPLTNNTRSRLWQSHEGTSLLEIQQLPPWKHKVHQTGKVNNCWNCDLIPTRYRPPKNRVWTVWNDTRRATKCTNHIKSTRQNGTAPLYT